MLFNTLQKGMCIPQQQNAKISNLNVIAFSQTYFTIIILMMSSLKESYWLSLRTIKFYVRQVKGALSDVKDWKHKWSRKLEEPL